MKAQRCRSGNPSQLNPGAIRKHSARDEVTVENITSFSSRPLKLWDFIGERDAAASAFLTPEVEAAKDVLVHSMKYFCFRWKFSFKEFLEEVCMKNGIEPQVQSICFSRTRRITLVQHKTGKFVLRFSLNDRNSGRGGIGGECYSSRRTWEHVLFFLVVPPMGYRLIAAE